MGDAKVVHKSKEVKMKAAMAGGRSKKKVEQRQGQGKACESRPVRQGNVRQDAEGCCLE